ncbi:hypothetical protein ACFOY8_14195 [Thalassospira xianhensis]|uniref:Uncharacterized protein n=2 Tax=Thalassospira TaxID=168934 RepID=A0A285TW36_9PROT|nr:MULTISPECIES: hypothetical protein [Thalassospira]RCK07693.1 hypothetical protein TH5_01070 [Thalassospira xianhensis MCCC 1A02616]SOC26411.1 hypothetical protein SAMN05428964_105112 [Thalassospira xiamenensis]
MIDVALVPKGSIVMMAHGDVSDAGCVRVRVLKDAVEIVEQSGRVIARTEHMAGSAAQRLSIVNHAAVLLAGRTGLTGYSAPVERRL